VASGGRTGPAGDPRPPGMYRDSPEAGPPGTGAAAELAHIDAILRLAGFTWPLGWRGVLDMATQLGAALERADELGARRAAGGTRTLADRVKVRLNYALAEAGHAGPIAQHAECSRVLGREVHRLADMTGPEMLQVIRAQPSPPGGFPDARH
jgi:hypothetical protein